MSGPTTVTSGDAVVRIDERGNVLMNGKVIDPSAAGKPQPLPYELRTVSGIVERTWEKHRAAGLARARRNRWLRTARIAVRLLQGAFILLWATAVGHVCDRFQVPPTWLSVCIVITLSLGAGLALDSAADWLAEKFR